LGLILVAQGQDLDLGLGIGSMSSIFSEAIYKGMEVYVEKNYPEKFDCIMKELRETKIADKIFSLELISNPLKFPTEIKPHFDGAVTKCTKSNDKL
jgi:hypothetical protein